MLKIVWAQSHLNQPPTLAPLLSAVRKVESNGAIVGGWFKWDWYGHILFTIFYITIAVWYITLSGKVCHLSFAKCSSDGVLKSGSSISLVAHFWNLTIISSRDEAQLYQIIQQ